MTLTRLRHVCQVNPPTPEFGRLPDDASVTFLPMEAVWSGERLDLSQRRAKSIVETGYTRFRSGDVLVPKITPTFEAARSVLAPELETKVGAGTTELHVLRPGPQMDPRYLCYIVTSIPFLRLGEAEMYGVAGQKRVPDDFVRNFVVDLPEVEEQRRIADFLDAETARIDRLVVASSRQEELVRERFVSWVRIQTTNASNEQVQLTGVPWMPEVARSWKLHKVGRAFRTGSGTTPKSTNDGYFGPGTPWLNTGDLTDGPIREIKRSVTENALQDYSSLRVFGPGSVVIAMYGATIGRLGVLESAACTNQACCVLYEPTSVDSSFAFYWFLAHREDIMTLASGGGQPNISQELVRSLRIPAPPLNKQREIVSKIRSSEARMAGQRQLLARRRELLAERKQALITAAVTGQLDVTTARGVDVS